MDTAHPTSNKVVIIKNIYLYIVSLVALLMVVFSVADVINIALKTYIFTKADQSSYSYPPSVCPEAAPGDTSTDKNATPCVTQAQQEKMDADNLEAQRQNSLVHDISYILVGIPLFLYHWGVLRKKEMN